MKAVLCQTCGHNLQPQHIVITMKENYLCQNCGRSVSRKDWRPQTTTASTLVTL